MYIITKTPKHFIGSEGVDHLKQKSACPPHADPARVRKVAFPP